MQMFNTENNQSIIKFITPHNFFSGESQFSSTRTTNGHLHNECHFTNKLAFAICRYAYDIGTIIIYFKSLRERVPFCLGNYAQHVSGMSEHVDCANRITIEALFEIESID